VCESLAPSCPHFALASLCAFLRHSPKVGAVCGNSARTDLCGGRWVTGVPTATHSSGAVGRLYCYN
ncbi:MAG: hypothetical protein ACLPVO_03515, partial [Desulfomonilaceae bacterium]